MVLFYNWFYSFAMQRFIHRALLKKLPDGVITVGNAVTLAVLIKRISFYRVLF